MKTLLPIDRQVEIPTPGRGRPKYPFRLLNPVTGNPPRGDSFLVECADNELERTMNILTSCAHRIGAKTGRKFALRRMKDGVRVWRIL